MNYLSLLVATVVVLAGSGSIVSVLGLRGLRYPKRTNTTFDITAAKANDVARTPVKDRTIGNLVRPAYYPFFGKVRSAVAG